MDLDGYPLPGSRTAQICKITAVSIVSWRPHSTRRESIRERFGLPLVLIIIDTLNAAGNFKDANDAAEGQCIMNRLGELSRQTGAFVLAVDHFGKAVETGTRGTSAKEAAADVVLALLAERDISRHHQQHAHGPAKAPRRKDRHRNAV